MTIDPPSSLINSLQALKTQQQDALNSLAKVLNIKVGEVLTGTVVQSSSVTPQTRQTLLNAYIERQPTNSNSGNLQQNNTQPKTNTAADRLELALLQSPKLKLVQVEVSSQKLLTFTDQPVQRNQQVQLLLKTPNQLQLQISQPQRSAAHQNAQPTGTGNGLSTHLQASKTGSQNAPQVLQQALRTALPQQHNQTHKLTDALQTIHLLGQLTQKLGAYSAQSLIPKNIQEALKSAASHLRSPEQLSQPATLKQAMRNSGIQLESKLAKMVNNTGAEKTGGKSNVAPSNVLAGNNRIVSPHSTPTGLRAPQRANAQAQQPPINQQDLKGALLNLLNRLQTTQGESSDKSQQASTNKLPTQQNTLLLVLRTLLQSAPQLAQMKQEIPREALIQQLQQLVQQAVNKIQYQQLQALTQKQTASTDQQFISTQNWQFEIPIRYGSEVHPLTLHIEEDWTQQPKEDDDEPDAPKARKWFIKLSFELPDAGYFHAHLTIINDAINASLWAEKPETLQKAQEQLATLKERLKKDGVEVKSLDCFPGKPQQQDNRLSYSLVDIKT